MEDPNMHLAGYVTVPIRVRKKHLAEIKAAAQAAGETIQVYIRNAVQQRIEREEKR